MAMAMTDGEGALFDRLWSLGELPLAKTSRSGTLTAWNPACAALGSSLAVGMSLAEWLTALGGAAALVRDAESGLAQGSEVVAVADGQLSVRLIAHPAGYLATVQAKLAGVSATELLHERRVRDEISQLAKVGGWEVDIDSQALRWDAQTFRIHEVPFGEQPDIEEAIQYYAPEAQPVIAAAVERAQRTGEGWDLELEFITATGRKIWVRATGRVDGLDAGDGVDGDGRPSGGGRRLWGVFQDINDQKTQALAVQRAYARARNFERLFEIGRTMACIANLDGTFERLNFAWTRVLGWSREELMSRPFIDFVHPEDVERTLRETARMGREGAISANFENRYRTKSGEWRWLSWQSSTECGQIFCVAFDVHEQRVWAEERDRLAAIAERTDNAVLVTDREGKITWVNAGFTRISGYEASEVLGRSPGSVLQGPDSEPRGWDRMVDRLLAGQAFNVETINYRRDGAPYWASIEAQPLVDASGEVTGFMAIERDITEAKRRAEALVAAKEEADANAKAAIEAARARSAFLASMSHEIRTPMNGVMGMAQLLQDTALDAKQRHFVQQIYASGSTLLRLLNDQLDLSKVEAGMVRIEPAPFSPRGLLTLVADLYLAPAWERGVVLRDECDQAVPEWLVGDVGRLRQVLFNLVGNATKFTEEGEVVVSLTSAGPGRWRFAVRDTGIGIDPALHVRIFDPYEQVGDSTTRRFAGSGLGLAICKELVSLMGGTIELESALGQGSCFSFVLALEEGPSKPATTAAAPVDLPAGLRVLLAEDNLINQEVVAAMLRSRGCLVTIVSDGAQALEALDVQNPQEQPFDAVLMDWHMPHTDGLTATRRIRDRERRTGHHMPIIMLTARVAEDDVRTCLDAGADHFIAKPVDWEGLVGVLGRCVPRGPRVR